MKVKIFAAGVVVFLLLVSLSQIFNIPPYAESVDDIYQSDYFENLDHKYEVISDSFMGIKILARPEYAWLFLGDIEKKHGIKASVYNKRGKQVFAPGYYSDVIDRKIQKLINFHDSELIREIHGGIYDRVILFTAAERCIVCHRRFKEGEVIGAMKVSGEFSSRNFYSKERILIFVLLSAFLVFILILVMKWKPSADVKELFDK